MKSKNKSRKLREYADEKKIIWSNDYESFRDYYDDWKDAYIDYLEINDEEVPDEVDENDVYGYWIVKNDDYLVDERANLSGLVYDKILCIGNIGTWRGSFSGYKIIDSGKVSDCLYDGNCDECTWYIDDDNEFAFSGSHHDGDNSCIYRAIKSNVDEDKLDAVLDKIYNQKEVSKEELDEISDKIGPDILKVYGLKEDYEGKSCRSKKESKKPMKESRKLREQVSQEAYDVADEIAQNSEIDFISRDDFDEQLALAIRKVFGIEDVWEYIEENETLPNGDDFNDFENDVRLALSTLYGWNTLYSGDDEGGMLNQITIDVYNKYYNALKKLKEALEKLDDLDSSTVEYGAGEVITAGDVMDALNIELKKKCLLNEIEDWMREIEERIESAGGKVEYTESLKEGKEKSFSDKIKETMKLFDNIVFDDIDFYTALAIYEWSNERNPSEELYNKVYDYLRKVDTIYDEYIRSEVQDIIKNNGGSVIESLKEGKKKLKEDSFNFTDAFEDLLDRAKLIRKDGYDIEDSARKAIEDGLIYNTDILELAEHYGVINYDELVERFYEDLYADLVSDLEDDKDTDIDESCEEKKDKKEKKELKEGFRGCKEVEMIYNGDYSDPELYYRDKDGKEYYANYWEVEDSMWDYYRDEYEYATSHNDEHSKKLNATYDWSSIKDEDDEEDFNKFVANNENAVIGDILDLNNLDEDDLDYDRRAVERDYDLEDGELDGYTIREAEELLNLEEGELDRYILGLDESCKGKGCKKPIRENRVKSVLDNIEDKLKESNIEYEIDVADSSDAPYDTLITITKGDDDKADDIICSVVGYAYEWYRDKDGKRQYCKVATQEDVIDKLNEDCKKSIKEGVEEKIVCYTYGKPSEFKSKKEAIKFFKNCIAGSDGAEKDRYTNVLTDILDDFKICWDQVNDLPEEVALQYYAQF